MAVVDKNRFAGPVAEILLSVGAVTINTKEWYVYSSGIISPIYCDMRWLISFPRERRQVVDYLISRLADELLLDRIDVISGVATAGIPYASWLSDRLEKPMAYVREASKSHGKRQQIEGRVIPEQCVLVAEDLFTTGRSALETVHTLRNAGAQVTHCVGIFDYGLATAQRAFENAKISPITLCSIRELLQTAQTGGLLSQEERETVEGWLGNYDKQIELGEQHAGGRR